MAKVEIAPASRMDCIKEYYFSFSLDTIKYIPVLLGQGHGTIDYKKNQVSPLYLLFCFLYTNLFNLV